MASVIYSSIMIIAGLGNPGKEYQNTRHNVGFWAIDALSNRFGAGENLKAHKGIISKFSFRGLEHLLLKPQTYMNLSGESVSSLLIEEEMAPESLIVIVDDINLPIGRIRIRASGSDGGHNGLKSIISHIGRKFWRIRVGVGEPRSEEDIEDSHQKLVSHVLGEISEDEWKIFENVLKDIPDIIALLLLGMGNQAMTKFNGKDFSSKTPTETDQEDD